MFCLTAQFRTCAYQTVVRLGPPFVNALVVVHVHGCFTVIYISECERSDHNVSLNDPLNAVQQLCREEVKWVTRLDQRPRRPDTTNNDRNHGGGGGGGMQI